MKRISILGSVGILVWGAGIAVAQVDSNVGFSSYAQSRGTPCTSRGAAGCGGCYAAKLPAGDPTSELSKLNPEWAPIGPMISSGFGSDLTVPPASQLVQVNATVMLTKINNGGDFPSSHITDDQNTFLSLDPADAGRIATGNSAATSCPGEGCGVVEMEREIGKYPLFAWAGEGDHITALGRWIFDCGHPDPDLGTCPSDGNKECLTDSNCAAGSCVGGVGGCTVSGARCIVDADCTSPQTCTNPVPNFNVRAEIHPPQAIVVYRDRNIGKKPAKQADVYISADAGGAGDTCEVTHLASAASILASGVGGKNCFTNHCSVNTSRSCSTNKDCPGGETCIVFSAPQLLHLSDFSFDIPLSTPPNNTTSTLKVTTKSFKPAGGQMPKPIFVLPTPPYGASPVLHVTVPLSGPLPNGKQPDVFAERIIAGWTDDVTPLTHVQVKFKSLTINNPLKSSSFAFPKQCTNTTGFGLSGRPCLVDKDCALGTCANKATKMCTSDKDCPKSDHCTAKTRCVGGVNPGWEMWGEVNGDWVPFKKLDTLGAKAPFLALPYFQPSPTPLVIPESFTFNEYVPAGGTVHLASTGHSLSCLDTMYGINLNTDLAQMGLGPGGACLASGNLNPGRIEVTHSGAGFATAAGATCTPVGALLNCSATTVGGAGGTCNAVPSRLCTSDSECKGICSDSSGPCSDDSDCQRCSVSMAFCGSNFDCPHGTCSNNVNQFCHVNSDCGGVATCNGSPQTCGVTGATCVGTDTCNLTGGAFTLNYTLKVIP